jgi:hypothetical protein
VTSRSVRRYEIPVGEPAVFELGGHPWRVETCPGRDGVVEFWTHFSGDKYTMTRTFQVFGTGHPVPEDAEWRGTTGRTRSGLVWQLFELRGG